jgi:hypothetical protein
MKKLLLTTSEFTNQKQEVKKKRVNVGRIHNYQDGGEAIVLDAAMCAVLGAMGQKAMNAGEDSVWVSVFDEDSNQQTPSPNQNPPQYQNQQPAPQQNTYQPQYQNPPQGQNPGFQ